MDLSQGAYEIGELVNVKLQAKWVNAVVMNIRAPLGFRMYDVVELDTGKSHTVTRLQVEKLEILNDLLADEILEYVLEEQTEQEAQENVKPNSRFEKMDTSEVDKLQKFAKSEKTHANTRWGVKIFKDWLIENDLPTDFENLKEDVLASHLRRFYAEVRQKNGKLYSKKSMLAIRAAIFRFLTEPPNNVTFNILNDTVFVAANSVLTGVCRQLKATGQDLSKHHPSIKKDDMTKLYQSGVLSPETPETLQQKVFFETVLHFGRRGREGLRGLKKSDIVFKTDENGREYATLAGNSLEKNHQGFSSREGEHHQMMYATGDATCPLTSLKFYLTKLNEKCSAFFQRPKEVNWENSPSWYVNSPLGVNPIGNMMPTISKAAKLSIIYTNHCIRATTVTTLRQAGVPTSDIIAVTGHRNESSLDHYCSGPNATTRQHMSETLTKASAKSTLELDYQPKKALPAPPSSSAVSPVSDFTVPALPLPVMTPHTASPCQPVATLSKSETSVATNCSETSSNVSLSQTSMTKISESTMGTLFSNVVFNNSNITLNVYTK